MNNDYLTSLVLLTVFAGFANSCRRMENSATFTDICRNENQTKVSIRGFLKATDENSGMNSEHLLLVENENGTGGFIHIEMPNERIINNNLPVKISGEVSKTENQCVLKMSKIEKP